MAKGDRLGGFEEEVLLGVAAGRERAHARTVYEHLVQSTGRDVSITAVHVTLARLVTKGYLVAEMGIASDTTDIRARKLYSLGTDGVAALRQARAAHEKLWGAASAHPGLR